MRVCVFVFGVCMCVSLKESNRSTHGRVIYEHDWYGKLESTNNKIKITQSRMIGVQQKKMIKNLTCILFSGGFFYFLFINNFEKEEYMILK